MGYHKNKQGAFYEGDGRCCFRVWAPFLSEVALKVVEPTYRLLPMERDDRGYWQTSAEEIAPGSLYYYRLDNAKDRPDPSSRSQPHGIHGPSQVIDHSSFKWMDQSWKGIPLEDHVIYELHTGTFTPEGTFEAIVPRLDYLLELGVTAIELMPVAQFPGERNWGYDGTYPYAPQNSYGGPQGLKMLVNECHKRRLAVLLDVVYNHLGPEGNYLWDYGPYFTDTYKTPWGDAINLDGPYSDDVRRYFIQNALYWIAKYHVDGFRIDAVHGMFDSRASHFLLELAQAVRKEASLLRRHIPVIAESNLNDVRVITPVEKGGYGLDGQWNDDFHHSVRTILTGERDGYYEDFGDMGDIEKAYREGFVYSGQYSRFRKRSHGNSSRERPSSQFVVFSQNHDQVGNRPLGYRPGSIMSLEKLKLAAGAVILSPFVPLLFMGEEYGEVNPFNYFVSYYDESLINAVKEGRRKEFEGFQWKEILPDPQDVKTFHRSRLNMESRFSGEHKTLLRFYKQIIHLRKGLPVLFKHGKEEREVDCFADEKAILVRILTGDPGVFYICAFSDTPLKVDLPISERRWEKVLDSSSEEWGGPGEVSPRSVEATKTGISLEINPFSIVLYRTAPCY